MNTNTDEIQLMRKLVDERELIIRFRIETENRLSAFKRKQDDYTLHRLGFLREFLETIDKEENRTKRLLSTLVYQSNDPVLKAILSVKGAGPMVAGYCRVFFDPYKAQYPSSFWKYIGIDKASHERYKKGVAGGGNKRLRNALWLFACNQVRLKDTPYKTLYYDTVSKLEQSQKITKTVEKNQGLVSKPWCECSKGHRRGAGLRVVMAHFSADLWRVWRTIYGLPVYPVYAEGVLGGGHKTILPEERGWVY